MIEDWTVMLCTFSYFQNFDSMLNGMKISIFKGDGLLSGSFFTVLLLSSMNDGMELIMENRME